MQQLSLFSKLALEQTKKPAPGWGWWAVYATDNQSVLAFLKQSGFKPGTDMFSSFGKKPYQWVVRMGQTVANDIEAHKSVVKVEQIDWNTEKLEKIVK